jgi:hypothetical protein
VSRIVVREASQDVHVFGVKRQHQRLYLVFDELLCKGVDDKLAKVAFDENWIARHQRLGASEQFLKSNSSWRILIISVDVLAMVTSAPTARIASEP